MPPTRADCERLYRAAVAERDISTAMMLWDALQEADAPSVVQAAARRWFERFGSCPDRTSGLYRIFTAAVHPIAYAWFGVDDPNA